MVESALTAMTFCIFLLVVWLISSRLFTRLQYQLTDLYAIVILASAPMALILQGFVDDFEKINGKALVGILIYCLFAEMPVIIGAWRGLLWAQRLNEMRALWRVGMIFFGVCAVGGALGFIWLAAVTPVALLNLIATNKRDDISLPMVMFGWVCTIALLYPAWLLERRCRQLAEEKREETRRAAREKKQKSLEKERG